MHIIVTVIAALAVLTAAFISELGSFWTQSAPAVSTPQSLETVQAAKSQIQEIQGKMAIKDLSTQDPAEACRHQASELAKERGRTKFAWATHVTAAKTQKIRTIQGNPAFLVKIKADSDRTFCAVIFEDSSCKVDMVSCSEEPKELNVSRFGQLAKN